MTIRKHRNGYDIHGYGNSVGALYNLSRDELDSLFIDISCQKINDDFDKFGKALDTLDKTIEEVSGD